ncbi:MAG: hypothetical protein Q8O84_01040 [Nanoarchaeota archaeon]|nr:hypothetical protein [Nanoarchaeota archaeon]
MAETLLQHPVLTNFVYPFLIVFFIVFAVLEKTKILGEEKRQINALISFVIGLIFVSAVYPKIFVGNMILFLSVAIVIVFVVLMLWGFVFSTKEGFVMTSGMKWGLFAVITIALIIGILWASGVSGRVYDFLFNQSWSEAFWTNLIFVILIGVALAAVIRSSGK